MESNNRILIPPPADRSGLPEIIAAGAQRRAEDLVTIGQAAMRRMEGLSQRQRQIMRLVLAGHPSKNIAADLGISQRTVECHRAAIMKRTGARSIPALARLALVADWHGLKRA